MLNGIKVKLEIMKKIFTILMVAGAVLAFAACSEKEDNGADLSEFLEKHKDDEPSIDKSTFAYFLSVGKDFKIKCEQIGSVPAIGDCSVAQGAVGNGNNAYLALKDAGDTKTIIVQYTISPFQLVAQSAPFNGQHSNDLAYCDPENMILVSHSSGSAMTSIDASTLKVIKENFNCGINNSAVSYNAKRDRYAYTGGKAINISTRDFVLENKYDRSDATGYTTQGMGSDNEYLYFPMSTSGGNKMVIYNWEGKLIKIIDIPVTIEAETMFVTGGKYYLSCFAGGSKKGAVLYRISPVE